MGKSKSFLLRKAANQMASLSWAVYSIACLILVSGIYQGRKALMGFVLLSSVHGAPNEVVQGLTAVLCVFFACVARNDHLHTSKLERLLGECNSSQDYIDKVPFPAFLTGPDGSDQVVNAAYCKLLGRDIGEVSGWQWSEHVDPNDYIVITSRWLAFASGRTDRFSESFRWRHPVRGWMRIHVEGYVNGTRRYGGVSERMALEIASRLVSEVAKRGN